MTNEEFCSQNCGCGKKFWEKYFAANEIEKINIIKSRPIFSKLKDGVWFAEFVTPTLLNSYIKDVSEYLIELHQNFSEQQQQ
jgi:hypothetical protein